MKAEVTSEKLFETLARRLQGQSELQVRITAHVREKTGHNTLFAYQQNGATEQEKVGLWKECLAAIVNDKVESLQGAAAVGQAAKPEESRPAVKSTPTAKPEGKAERIAESPAKTESGEIDQLRELLGKILGSRKQEMDEARVWEIAASVTQTAVTNALADFAATFKAPPRDVVEIRKWDGTAKEIGPLVHRQFKQVMQFVTARNTRGYPIPLYLWGGSGSGKTFLFKQIAEALGLKCYPIPLGPTTTEGRLLGFPSLAQGQYVAGLMYEGYKNGGVVGLDEFDIADPGVGVAVNAIGSNEEFMFPNGEVVQRHKDFVLIVGANTRGTGQAQGYCRNKLDAATLDRWAFLELEYDNDLEATLSGNAKWASHVVKVRTYAAAHCGGSLLISPRCSVNGAALLANGIEPEQVENATIYKLASNEVRQNIRSNVGNYQP